MPVRDRKKSFKKVIVAANARSEDPRDEATANKVVTNSRVVDSMPADSPPAATTTPKPDKPTKVETTANSERIKAREHSTTPPGSNFAKTWGKSLGPKPQAKVYQKHVLFALVSAFLIQIIANGKSLPKAGS